MATAVNCGIQVVITGPTGYPSVLWVGKANGAITSTAADFFNRLPSVASIRGRQKNAFAAPVGDRRLDAHPAVGGIEEENLGGGSPADALGQNGEALDCPTGAAVRG